MLADDMNIKDLQPAAAALGVLWATWQGVLLWRARPVETR